MDLGIHPVTLSKWVKQDRIDRGEIFGTPSSESVELLAKLAAERVLDQGDIAVLGGLRQAFKSLRRHIRANETIPWTSDRSKEYVAFKSLASAMSALLTRNHPRKQPSAAAVNQAFAEITANRHERTRTAVPSTREP